MVRYGYTKRLEGGTRPVAVQPWMGRGLENGGEGFKG